MKTINVSLWLVAALPVLLSFICSRMLTCWLIFVRPTIKWGESVDSPQFAVGNQIVNGSPLSDRYLFDHLRDRRIADYLSVRYLVGLRLLSRRFHGYLCFGFPYDLAFLSSLPCSINGSADRKSVERFSHRALHVFKTLCATEWKEEQKKCQTQVACNETKSCDMDCPARESLILNRANVSKRDRTGACANSIQSLRESRATALAFTESANWGSIFSSLGWPCIPWLRS